jgi:hypothetical protein
MRWKSFALSIVFVGILIGCNQPGPAKKGEDTAKKGEEEIKAGFASLQSAIKAKDADKIWSMLAQDSRADTEREAKATKEAFAKLDDKDKAGFEKKIGLASAAINGIDGKLYVKSNFFFSGEVDEMPDSKLDKVVMSGESATVHYTEEKGGKEKLPVVREEGKWKFAVPVPKAVLK